LTDSGITDFDLYLFGEGKHERIYDKLGGLGVAEQGSYQKMFDSDDVKFGGSGYSQQSRLSAAPEGAQGYPYSLRLDLPPLGAMFLIGPA
jgi:hypothetical protein